MLQAQELKNEKSTVATLLLELSNKDVLIESLLKKSVQDTPVRRSSRVKKEESPFDPKDKGTKSEPRSTRSIAKLKSLHRIEEVMLSSSGTVKRNALKCSGIKRCGTLFILLF